jgi:hypothetical protein
MDFPTGGLAYAHPSRSKRDYGATSRGCLPLLFPVGETIEFGEAAAVEVAIQEVEIAGQNPMRLEPADFFGAGIYFFRGAVQDGGRWVLKK